MKQSINAYDDIIDKEGLIARTPPPPAAPKRAKDCSGKKWI